MPRPAKGPRLYRRKDTGFWLIRDTGQSDRSTGTRDREQADQILAEYIQGKRREYGTATPDQMTVGAVLDIYGEEHAPHAADPVRIGYAIKALLPFWATLTVSSIKGEVCRRYAKSRGVSDGTVRRELGTLRAALNYCQEEGYLTAARPVWLPEKPPAKERWLTRDEAARLLWAAYRLPRGKHLARFILVGLYTGTRKAATLKLRYMPHVHGGHVDLERGLLYRRGAEERETKKRQTPARIPRQLLGHLRRWEREGGRYVVEWKGAHTAEIRKAWAAAVEKAGLEGVTPHTLKHTAITWSLQRGSSTWDAAGFFGTSVETIERTYGHHSPDYQESAVGAMERK